MLNQLLGGHYQIVQDLQEGGLAKTYIAEDHHRPGHPKCAVKFLKPASNQPDFLPTARRLFQQEAEILEKLGQHEQIPRLLAYFEEKEQFYLVQEFIEGHTLSTEMPRGYCWAESRVIQMLQDVLQILKFVHSYGVIHRDIKPNNLIRRQKDGRLVLIDFGAVKQVRAPFNNNHSSLAHKTIAIGTQGYMPTEQVRGKPRLNSDIYALGMIGIQALTGVHPLYFQEDEEGELIWQDLAKVSQDLATILTKMVRYHFKDRYQLPTEVLRDLQPLAPPSSSVYSNINSTCLAVESLARSPSQQISTSFDDTWIPWDSEVITEVDLGETKLELDLEQTSSEVEEATKIQKTKVTLKAAPATPSKATSNNSWQWWNILGDKFKKSDYLSAFSRSPQLSYLRFLLKSLEEQKKVFLASTVGLMSPAKDIKSSKALTFLRLNKSQLLLGTGITSATIGILTGYSHINNSHLQAEQALAKIEELQASENYQKCLEQAQIFPQYYAYLQAEAATLQRQCELAQATEVQLQEAKQLAEQSRLKDAIAIATGISEDTIFYGEAQELVSQWSEQIFQIANNKYREGNFPAAIAIAEAVPVDNPLAEKVQLTIEQWEEEWQQNQAHLKAAQKKLDERRWQDAIKSAQQVSQTNYWQQQSEPIIRRAKAEITASQVTAKKTPKKSSSSNSNPRLFPRNLSNSLRSKPVKRSSSPKRSSSNPRYTSKMTCKNRLHPKCL